MVSRHRRKDSIMIDVSAVSEDFEVSFPGTPFDAAETDRV